VPGTSRAEKYARSIKEGIKVDRRVWQAIIRFGSND
jgi:LDH2 family malate/lactate/ureidoglycolate dehydrogenase